ncbi:MAG: ComEC/Rec2 family competence protein [Sphingomonadaceae bacterium]
MRRVFGAFALTVIVILAAVVTGCATPPPPRSGGEMLLAVLDVGQGDCILVRSPSGRTMMVDGSHDRGDVERAVLPYLESQGISSLDYLVLTHPDQDHVGGMPALLEAVRVDAFVDAAPPGQTNQSYLRTLQLVRSKGIEAIKARRDQTSIDLGAETRVEVLGPEDPLLRGESADNDNSVVLRITYGSVSALLTGDLERDGERRILSHATDIRSQILKVSHHGSQGATSADFLAAVDPEVAIISVGAGNQYGHPHRQMLQRLELRKVDIYRTDLQGTIQVTIDGRGYRVEPQRQGG